MNKRGIIAGFAILAAAAASACRTEPPLPAASPTVAVKPGIDVLVGSRLDLVRGKKVGLITNPSGVGRDLRSSIDLLRSAPGATLVALYGPEHGVRGNAQAGEFVPYVQDEKYGLPVFSLYGPSMKAPKEMFKDIDEYMRSFDTTHEDKKLESGMTAGLDVLIFDIQDIGTRIYTFEATMAYAMQSAAEAGIEYIVLDRPNPVGGTILEGPILEYPEFSSFVGLYPVPLRFGMTIGELARMVNDLFLKTKAKLTVIPMEGWKRDMWFDETGLPWVVPSPNIPTLETAVVYPGQVFIEGTNLSEGRGTTKPFEFFGAPWIDAYELTKTLNALALPGVAFREQWFTPTFSKFKGELCGGCQVHVADRGAYRPLATALHIIKNVRDGYPGKFEFHAAYFDKIMGTSSVRTALEAGKPVREIVAGFEAGLRGFEERRKPYLLY